MYAVGVSAWFVGGLCLSILPIYFMVIKQALGQSDSDSTLVETNK